MQGDAEGRLLSYSPATGETLVLADNIWLANGVAVSHDESFVVVASTASMRLYKYWLKGAKVIPFPSTAGNWEERASSMHFNFEDSASCYVLHAEL